MTFWWLSRLFGGARPEDLQGARLDDPNPHIVHRPADPAVFLRALPVLLPAGVVYFEGPDDDLRPWLAGHAMSEPLQIALGTVWPKLMVYHVTLSDAHMTQAAAIVDERGIAIPSIHLHVHDGNRVVLEWHDAFGSDPMYIRSDVPPERLAAFLAQLRPTEVVNEDVGAPHPLPRWVRIPAGLLLFLWAGLALTGSIALIVMPPDANPALTRAIGTALALGSFWGLMAALRLIAGRQLRTGGLLTPLALRVTGAIIGVIPLIALVTGTFWESERTVWSRIAQAVGYIALAAGLFGLASTRTRAMRTRSKS